MSEEQIKRRDELAEVLTKEIIDDGFWVGLGKDLETKFRAAILFFVHSAYRAGFADAKEEMNKHLDKATDLVFSACDRTNAVVDKLMSKDEQITELARKLEVAKKAFGKIEQKLKPEGE